MGLRSQLLFVLVFCFHCFSSSESVFVVQWDSSGPSDINNHLNVIFNDVIRFNCTNEVSNVYRVESEQAYNQCDTNAARTLVGNCQADVQVISVVILEGFGVYQSGNRYYFYSTHGSDCANGVKLSINVLQARPTSSTVQSTTTASSTMNPTGTSTSGAITGSTRTITGSTGTITGSTETITGSTTSSSSATSASPTVGGSDESGSSFLEKLPLREYFLVIVAVVIIILLLLIVLPVSIMCFRKRRGSRALVKLHEEEKDTYKKMESVDKEKNKAVYRHEQSLLQML